ncbi:MAG: MFS transporter [Proteobacteria bacterium]|nr:MAG: MFS transporter [Pseudomonadota bacterium]
MNKLIATAIANARTVLTTLALIFIGGIYAYSTIPKEENPDVDIPYIYINLVHQGISPEDAERLLVKPIEPYLRGLDGLKEVKAIAHEGGAGIIIEFNAGFNADQALLDVREAIDKGKTELPDDTDEPVVTEINVSLFPIATVVLSGELPERVLVRLARDLQDSIESLPGVLEAAISGDREELLEVVVRPELLESYRVSQQDLINVVMRNNRLVAAGAMEASEGRFAVKVPGVFESAKDVLSLPVKVSGDGVVTLGDLTEVRRTYMDPASFARVNGKPAVALNIRKRTGENVIETIASVRATVAAAERHWPAGVKVDLIQDRSEHIVDMITSLQNSVISAVLLVAIVVVAALGFRAAGLVGMSVPGSFLLGILFLYAFGNTLNQVVLFGLILAVGMLVDGAIVITEFADRKMAEGVSSRAAYTLSAQRMAWPIISSTATTLAAFVPLLFWPGMIGGFMKYLPLTLIYTLAASLVMALIFVPTLGARIGRASKEHSSALEHLSAEEPFDLDKLEGLTGFYARLLMRLVRNPWRFLGWTLGIMALITALYVVSSPKVILFPEGEPNNVTLQVHARGNLSIWERDNMVRKVEDAIKDVAGIETRYVEVGGGNMSIGRDVAEDVIGSVTLLLENWRDRPRADDIIDMVRERTKHLPGIVVEPVKEEMGPVSGKNIDIEISAADPALIMPAAARLRAYMDDLEGLEDIEDTRPLPGIEWQLTVDRAEAGRFGADIATVGNVVQLVTNGIKIGEYRPDDADEEIEIRVRYPEQNRTLEQLDALRVQTPMGNVPVSNFLKREAKPKVSSIERVNANRVLSVRANVGESYNAFEKIHEIQAWIDANENNPQVRYTFRGDDEETRNATVFLTEAFFVAVFLMSIILLAQFDSFYHATLIMAAVLMSVVGVLLGMLITGRDFVVIMTGVGIVSLAGIVVNNNIILIDTYDRLRKTALPPLEAIVRTGSQRLRPVMLTTITTVIGLLPMMFGLDVNFMTREVVFGAPSVAIWIDLATSIVFGLSFATVLTLLITPCLLAVRIHARKKLRQRRKPPGEAPDKDEAESFPAKAAE